MSHAVMVSVQPALTNRNRLTTAFRFILVIPHVLLVGAVGVGAAWQQRHTSFGSETGVLGAVAFLLAVVSWFTILIGHQHIPAIRHLIALVFLVVLWWLTSFAAWLVILSTGEYPAGLYNFGVGVLRWLLRVEGYILLLVDEYPPF